MGLMLVNSAASIRLVLSTGIRMDLLCEIGRVPAQREQLQCTVRKGRRASTKPARGMMG